MKRGKHGTFGEELHAGLSWNELTKVSQDKDICPSLDYDDVCFW